MTRFLLVLAFTALAVGVQEQNYIRRIYDKTGMGHRTELALWYWQHRK